MRISHLLWDMVKRDFKNKYAGSYFGFAWNLLSPFAFILIYTLVFSQIMAARLPNYSGQFDYSIYLSSGILAWTVFSNTIIRLQNCFIENSNIVKKIKFPKIFVPVSICLSSIIELLMNYSVFIIILIVIGKTITISLLYLLYLIFLMQILCLGIGLILSVLTVHFRDLTQLMSIFISIWFWMTPVVYVKEILPQQFKTIIEYNPVFPFISAFQNVIMDYSITNVVSTLLIAASFVIIGGVFYKVSSNDMADLL